MTTDIGISLAQLTERSTLKIYTEVIVGQQKILLQ